MNYSSYATIAGSGVLDSNTIVQIGPTLGGADGYSNGGNLVSNAIDLDNCQQFAATCSFLTGSTLVGTLELQICNDRDLPDSTGQPPAYAQWVTITAPTTSIVAISSGAQNVVYNYPLVGHAWIRFNFIYTSGSGLVSFAYTMRSA